MKGWPGEPDMEYDVLMADGEAAANAGKPITDVIFDFGNVLIYWDPAAVMTPRYDDELVERFLDNDISGFYDINNLLDGGMSNDEGVALMRKTSGPTCCSTILTTSSIHSQASCPAPVC